MPVAIDLFAGCGGLTEGLKQAGFKVSVAVEIDKYAATTYSANHIDTEVLLEDIRNIDANHLLELSNGNIDLIAGCPPCQGFSSIKRLNKDIAYDKRNELILEFYRIIEQVRPNHIMMENVPGLQKYDLFQSVVSKLKSLGYFIDYEVVNVADFGVPQRRKRLVLLGSLIRSVRVPKHNEEDKKTVRDFIYDLPSPSESNDDVHKIHSNHIERIKDMIRLIPENGGNRKDLPMDYWLECHKKDNVGFNDVYGRLKWDDYSSTITGGCLNPSKGRFLHPVEHRSISAREAALIQTFPKDYKFPIKSKTAVAQMIGNAFPPKVSKYHGEYLKSIILDND